MHPEESLLQPVSLQILFDKGLYLIGEEHGKQLGRAVEKEAATLHIPPRDFLVISTEELSAGSPQRSLLDNILQACQISGEQVHYLGGYQGGEGYQSIRQQFGAKFILLFGTGPASVNLPVIFPEYQVQSFHGASYLWAPSLTELNGNKAAKAQLWQSLKKALAI